ncbi:MAG TPA: Wzz/FepE/Etk N-terminal domain-containing protein [Terriglobales bacterium]|nr:Wzz/FepE/Etk N-terminal domain-containing protein [Terriglobales bacterium]
MREPFEIIEYQRPFTLTLRDVAAVLFRHQRLLLISFIAILVAVLLSGVLSPTYKAEMKFLVRRERVDPVVTSQPNAPPQIVQEEISESELNSEVELLNSQDLLRKVVLETGLAKKQMASRLLGSADNELAIARAVRQLAKKLKAEPLRKTNVISVSYESSYPEVSALVLKSVADLYMQKHLAVHRPSGEFTFFDQETAQLHRGLENAEARLADFTRHQGVVSGQLERDLTLQKASDLEASLTQTQATMAETQRRISTLEEQIASIPPRMVTQKRTADNPQLLQQMKSTLLTLELKRTELLTKFDPSYRTVQEVEKQIRETRAAIDAEGSAPLRDETTDRDPTHEWARAELVKAHAELSGLQARAAAEQAALARYRGGARSLQESSIVQQDLIRAARTEEENYLLYLRKQEEARINDALDRRGILNVAIAEAPTVPALPSRSRLLYGMLSILLAATASVGLVFTADFLDPSFRTPDEVTVFLDSPVLASFPKNGNTHVS